MEPSHVNLAQSMSYIKYQVINDRTVNKLRNALSQCDWQTVLSCDDVDAAYNTSHDIVKTSNAFSKIFEKILQSRLIEFLNINSILNPNQYGFQNAHSTDLAIVEAVQTIIAARNCKKSVFAIFMGLSRAFDTVSSKECYPMGFVVLLWIFSKVI